MLGTLLILGAMRRHTEHIVAATYTAATPTPAPTRTPAPRRPTATERVHAGAHDRRAILALLAEQPASPERDESARRIRAGAAYSVTPDPSAVHLVVKDLPVYPAPTPRPRPRPIAAIRRALARPRLWFAFLAALTLTTISAILGAMHDTPDTLADWFGLAFAALWVAALLTAPILLALNRAPRIWDALTRAL